MKKLSKLSVIIHQLFQQRNTPHLPARRFWSISPAVREGGDVMSLTENQAKEWGATILELLGGRELITTAIGPNGRVDIRQSQYVNNTYTVEYGDGTASVAVCDSYGVMSGAQQWSISPEQRTIRADVKNAFGEPLIFTWTITNHGGDRETYYQFREAQEKMWGVK